MAKKYQIQENSSKQKFKLAKCSLLLTKLLSARGIKDEDSAKSFLNPDYDNGLHNPSQLKDIKKAAERILTAFDKDQKILIYSDYDADGIPGAVILYDFFKKIGYENFSNYIPHRNDEGFGLNIEAVQEAKKLGVDLIITIDCGITDLDAVKEANKLGLGIIITDHHLAESRLPPAFAIVNPNQPDDNYPFKFLCGSAVVFKLIQVLIELGQFDISSGWEKWLLDMVGLATISDMVPLVGENRIFAYYGLLVLRKARRLGLRRLYQESRLNYQNLSEDDLSFVITPRLNAASRMDEAYTAFNLLKATNESEATETARRLSILNNQRKTITATIVKEIKRKFAQRELPIIIVSGSPKWRPSVLGLVAGHLAEEFNRPVFLWGRNGNGEIRGSCRSDQLLDVYKLMKDLPHGFLDHFGGHKFSGGFGISNNNVHFLEEKLLACYKQIKSDKTEGVILIDAELNLEDLDWPLVDELEKLAPFGIGNPKPLFIFKNLILPDIQSFGRHSEHLKINFTKKNGDNFSAIKFFARPDSFGEPLEKGKKIDLIATLEKSYFKNMPELRLRITDILQP